MTNIAIGTLEQVPVRSVWPKEAGDFTPWLAENVELMSDALGMELELEGKEVSVGGYSADLVFRDLTSGALVVVENMYGLTDHDHLGKLITYAAGLDASHAVLLTETFRAEHRSALTWLNSISTEGCGFFGLSLEVWRIGDSIPLRGFGSTYSLMTGPRAFASRRTAKTASATPCTGSSGRESSRASGRTMRTGQARVGRRRRHG